MTGDLVSRFGYLGIIFLLVLGGLGLPVPEEAPVILAGVLSRKGAMWWPLGLGSCFVGVLLGDFVVYFLGYAYGEKVLSFRIARKFLTKEREAQIKGYFHRHGIKILIVGRFAVGFRTAAYLTAGILRLPPLNLLIADLLAASLSTGLMFVGGYFFADWIESGIKEAKHYVVPAIGAVVACWLLYRFYKGRRRAGLPVGPPVPLTDEVPIPPDDLHPRPDRESLAAGDGLAIPPTPAAPAAPLEPPPASDPFPAEPLDLAIDLDPAASGLRGASR